MPDSSDCADGAIKIMRGCSDDLHEQVPATFPPDSVAVRVASNALHDLLEFAGNYFELSRAPSLTILGLGLS